MYLGTDEFSCHLYLGKGGETCPSLLSDKVKPRGDACFGGPTAILTKYTWFVTHRIGCLAQFTQGKLIPAIGNI